ncbi:MAG TPA: ATP-binding protein [Gemmatimonadales bacterium]|nr:ATP-binding protein [Gemmatimonadales bacterium]
MVDPLSVLAELTRFGRALTGQIRRETVAAGTLEALERVFVPSAAAVALVTEPGGRLTIAASSGEPTPSSGDQFLQLVHTESRVVRQVTPPRLGAPLVAANHTLGIVAVWGKNPGAFDESSEAVIAALAAQAALALQNTRILEILSVGKTEWEQMVDAIRPAICVLDPRGVVRRANRSFATLVGAPVTTLNGRPWLMLLPPAWAEPVERALASPGVAGAEIKTDRRTYSVICHRVADGHASVLLIEDITDTKRLQEQLIQSEKLSAIGQLIAGVAHELNNPLASVLGFADFLTETSQLPPNLSEPVRVIQHEAQRAAGIVRNLLTFARRQDQERRRIEIGPILQRTLALLNNQLIGLKVEPHLVIEPDLPEIVGSPNQLQQVILNIVNNAAQAIASTGRPGTVVVRARPWLDGLAVDISDNGPGIPEELHSRVFEPFFSTKPEGEGTGLGLSICQGIIKEHNGRITLKSAPGRGATFTIELPRARETVAATAPSTSTMPAAGRVLVVDDEPHILHYMRATLESWGHRVETAADGEEALKRALSEPFDLIVTDVRMPRLGGREFYERLLSERPDLAARVVFATGDTVRDDTLAFLENSGRPFLHKPFKLAELRSTLAMALGT